jgi:hypothetical protein
LTLRAFQHALSDLVASPSTCLAVRAGGDDFFRRFDLSELEKNRLLEVVWQKGMSVSCSIYRSNRITPLYTLLRYSCLLLAGRLKAEVDEYWATSDAPDMQFKPEVERFARFLKNQLAAGMITDPFLDEILDYELAVNALQFIPRQKILAEIEKAKSRPESDSLQLNPLVRVVRFRHEPSELLEQLGEEQVPRSEIPRGEFFIVVDATEDPIQLKQLNSRLGGLLSEIQANGIYRQHSPEVMELVRAGLVVPVFRDWNAEKGGPCQDTRQSK